MGEKPLIHFLISVDSKQVTDACSNHNSVFLPFFEFIFRYSKNTYPKPLQRLGGGENNKKINRFSIVKKNDTAEIFNNSCSKKYFLKLSGILIM